MEAADSKLELGFLEDFESWFYFDVGFDDYRNVIVSKYFDTQNRKREQPLETVSELVSEFLGIHMGSVGSMAALDVIEYVCAESKEKKIQFCRTSFALFSLDGKVLKPADALEFVGCPVMIVARDCFETGVHDPRLFLSPLCRLLDSCAADSDVADFPGTVANLNVNKREKTASLYKILYTAASKKENDFVNKCALKSYNRVLTDLLPDTIYQANSFCFLNSDILFRASEINACCLIEANIKLFFFKDKNFQKTYVAIVEHPIPKPATKGRIE